MPWDEQTLLVGKALGREEQAQKVVDDVEAKFERVREAHPEFDGQERGARVRRPRRLRRVRDRRTTAAASSPTSASRRPTEIDKLAGESFYAQFSQEQFRLMDQDLVVMYGAQKDILANPVFKRLDAVKEDRVVYLDLTDQFAGALGFASALSLPCLLDEAEDVAGGRGRRRPGDGGQPAALSAFTEPKPTASGPRQASRHGHHLEARIQVQRRHWRV